MKLDKLRSVKSSTTLGLLIFAVIMAVGTYQSIFIGLFGRRTENFSNFNFSSKLGKSCPVYIYPSRLLQKGSGKIDLLFGSLEDSCDPKQYNIAKGPTLQVVRLLTSFRLSFPVQRDGTLPITVTDLQGRIVAQFPYHYHADRSNLVLMIYDGLVCGLFVATILWIRRRIQRHAPEAAFRKITVSGAASRYGSMGQLRPLKRAAMPVNGLVETVPKITVAVVGGLYGLGLLLSSVYYHSRSIPALSLARPVYVLTGFWFVAPILLALMYLLAFHYRSMGWGFSLLSVPFGIVSMGFGIALALGARESGNTATHGAIGGTHAIFIGYFFVLSLFSMFLMACVSVAIKDPRIRRDRSPYKVVTLLQALPIAALPFAIYTSLFLYVLMPRLDQGLGGGEAKQVRFILKSNLDVGNTQMIDDLETSQCTSEPFGLSSGLRISKPYSLIFSDSDDYYLKISKTALRPERTLAVPHSNVVGILYGNSDDSGGPPDEAFESGDACW
ncbi:MAG: hypothetical protein WBY53_20500 [Acidobacteriaceae bacterium]